MSGQPTTPVQEGRTDERAPVRLRVAAITPGRHVPSARYRVRQLLSAVRESGVLLRELVPLVSTYPPKVTVARPLWGTLAVAARLPLVAATHAYQMTLLQREMVSTLVTLEGWTKQPRVLDVDDAIFLHRSGRTAEAVARMCDSVICGNDFLAEWFRRWNSNVAILPTAVDTGYYAPGKNAEDPSGQTIGWIGTSANLRYLYQIEDALEAVLASRKKAKLVVVSDAQPSFRSLPADQVAFRRWTPDDELPALQAMSIGIMPLEDSLWARGKCSFKMLSYMACGLPVVASPVGMNTQVFALGRLGIPARTRAEWIEALTDLLGDSSARYAMGRVGREVAEKHFSVTVIAPRLAAHLLSVAGSAEARRATH